MRDDLIFDIGMHTGADTARYIGWDYRVVGVEANPKLVRAARERFADAIASGWLMLEGVGLHDEEGELPFIVNGACDEWSSFEPHLGARDDTPHETVMVPTKPLRYLIEKYGMPYYMKFDIEGMDARIARQLGCADERPAFISIEDGGIETLDTLREIGVRAFNFANQIEVRERYGPHSSGPFGDRLRGAWLDPDSARAFYLTTVRPAGEPPINGWWDIHGMF